MSTKRRGLALLGLAVLVVCAAALWALYHRRGAAPGGLAEEPAAALGQERLDCDRALVYAVHGEMRSGAAAPLRSYELTRTPVILHGEERVVRLDLQREGTPPARVYAVYEATGHLTSLYRDPGSAPAALNHVKTLAMPLQLVSPPADGQATWETSERDLDRWARVRYVRPDGGGAVEKTRLSLTPAAPTPSSLRYALAASRITADLAPAGWIERLRADETLSVSMLEGAPQEVSVHYEYELTRQVDVDRASAETCRHGSWQDLVATGRLEPLPLSLVEDPEQIRRVAEMRALAVPTIDSLRELQKPFSEDKLAVRARNLALLDLTERLTYDEAAVAEVLREALANTGNDRYESGLIGALGGADSPAAQAALLDLLERWRGQPGQAGLLERVARAHHLAPHPAPANVAALYDLGMDDDQPEDAREAALLAGSVAARHLGDPELVTRYEEGLASRVLAAPDAPEAERRQAVLSIEALGNLGDRRAAEPLMALAISGDDELAAHAVYAMRDMKGADLDDFLVQRVIDAPSERTRAEALRVLATRPLAQPLVQRLVDAYPNLVTARHDDALRSLALKVLNQPELRDAPAVVELAHRQAAQEPLGESERRGLQALLLPSPPKSELR